MSEDAFPDPPKGSPGGIRSAARSLKRAGRDLDQVATGLTGATGALAADWNGDAAGRYQTASQGLTSVAKAAGRTLADCAQAVDGYAEALDSAQREIAKLKVAYEDAKARERAAAGAAQRLAGQLLTADPMDVSGLESRIADASGNARDAGGEAGRIAGRARNVLDDFKREEKKADSVLSGQSVPGGGGLAGGFGGPGLMPAPGVGNGLAPGFGVPLGGLSPYNGVVRVGDPWNSDIPGLGTYWDSKHGAVQPVDDLTNVVLFAAGGVGAAGLRGLGLAARELAGGTGEALGLTGERAAIRKGEQKAFDETLAGSGRSQSFRTRLIGARAAGRNARAEVQVGFKGRRADTLKATLETLDKARVPLPPGAAELLPHAYRFSTEYKYYVLARLLSLRTFLERRGTPAAMRAARVITRAVTPR